MARTEAEFAKRRPGQARWTRPEFRQVLDCAGGRRFLHHGPSPHHNSRTPQIQLTQPERAVRLSWPDTGRQHVEYSRNHRNRINSAGMTKRPACGETGCHRVLVWLLLIGFGLGNGYSAGSRIERAAEPTNYPDGRPTAKWRLEAKDEGVVFRHGGGPRNCDYLGARDVWVWEAKGVYYMHYDGAGAKGWLSCLATTRDLRTWTRRGPALEFGRAGTKDAGITRNAMIASFQLR